MRTKQHGVFASILFAFVLANGCTGGPSSTAPRIPVERGAPIAKSAAPAAEGASSAISRAVMISIDGLAARFVEPMWEEGSLPALARLKQEGAFTLEARTDVHNTTTMPNHTCMLTGLPVAHTEGFPETAHHGFLLNVDPPPYATLHNAGNTELSYIPGVFDVAHDMGLKTCLFASKSKFVIYDYSYNEKNGAPDSVGEDNGRDKIDIFTVRTETAQLVSEAVEALLLDACDLLMLHIQDPDSTGHLSGWGSEPWKESVRHADALVGQILDAVQGSAHLQGKTAILLTADHGGSDNNHWDTSKKAHFAVPFFVWAPGVPAGADLYGLLSQTRRRPGDLNPPFSDTPPPIRNGDLGNTALRLLGLPITPGSIMLGLNLPMVGP